MVLPFLAQAHTHMHAHICRQAWQDSANVSSSASLTTRPPTQTSLRWKYNSKAEAKARFHNNAALWEIDIPSATVWAFHAFPSLIRTQQESCDWRHPSPTHTYYQCPSLLSRKVMWPSSASRVGGGEADWTCSLLGGQSQLYGRKSSYHNACRRSAPGSVVRNGKLHF